MISAWRLITCTVQVDYFGIFLLKIFRNQYEIFFGLNFAGFARSSSSQKFIAAYQPFFVWLLWQHEIYLWKLVVANQFIASKLQNNVIANKSWLTVFIFLPPPSNLHLHPSPHSVSSGLLHQCSGERPSSIRFKPIFCSIMKIFILTRH